MINEKIKNLTLSLDEQLDTSKLKNLDFIETEQDAIEIIHFILLELRVFTIQNGFNSTKEEIDFFKYKKPKILARLIYHKAIHLILVCKPHGGSDILKQYLNEELIKLKIFFEENIELYAYYRTKSDTMDHIYFIRENPSVHSCDDLSFYQNDHLFCTSHDFRMATIIANGEIEIYLVNELAKITEANLLLFSHTQSQSTPLIWTDTKTSLTELIYGLYTQGVFNNGKATLNDISKHFQLSFNIKLVSIYKIFQEMRERKINPLPFFDSIKKSLLKYIEHLEDKLN